MNFGQFLCLILISQIKTFISSECGTRKILNFVDLIVGYGSETYSGEWPWHVPIFHKHDGYLCGSSIISNQHLLTAAHCTSDVLNQYALLGHYNISNKYERNSVKRTFSAVFVHNDYNETAKYFKSYSDIAIYKMTRKVEFTDYVQPICLPSNNENAVNRNGFVIGYGSKHPKKIMLVEVPEAANINSIDSRECIYDLINNYFRITSDKSFCGRGNDAIPCKGDSGGGFHVKNFKTQRYTVYGIVSQGVCDVNKFAAFVDVTKFVDWIHEKIDPNNNENPECKTDTQCADEKACRNEKCIDLCHKMRCRAMNAECIMEWHEPMCQCKEGYRGDPDVGCLQKRYISGRIIKLHCCQWNNYPVIDKEMHGFDVDKEVVIFMNNFEIPTKFMSENVEVFRLANFDEDEGIRQNVKYLPIEIFQVFPKLKAFYAISYSIENVKKETFRELKELEFLRLWNNKIQTIDSNAFEDLFGLRFLSLEKNQIRYLYSNTFKNNHNLEKFTIEYNLITSLSAHHFENLLNLNYLDLCSNQFESLDKFLFSNLQNLKTLYLCGNPISSLPDGLFDNLIKLENIYLQNNRLTTLSGEIFSKNKELKVISMIGNQFVKINEAIFNNKPNLSYVDLRENFCIENEYGSINSNEPMFENEKNSLINEVKTRCNAVIPNFSWSEFWKRVHRNTGIKINVK